MLFTSYEFILLFLPLTVGAYLFFGKGVLARSTLLVIASIVFYASWNWRFLLLLLGSIAANYVLGVLLQNNLGSGRVRLANWLTGFGIVLNLGILGLFKYAHFTIDNLNALAGTNLVITQIILPLGISFFTFEQIGFLIDLRRGAPYRLDPLRYAVFVSFFPRLVAGPILRYNEIVPQLEHDAGSAHSRLDDLALGLSIFAIGMAKKAFFADGIAPFVAQSFDAAAAGQQVDFFAAWGGALAYTCQLYFDFSGYSDMAIGAARCFGIRFPENFDSPYKSTSIIDFWRRWHMTLSRFLRDYLYIALGGNRRGPVRRYINLLLTMLLGGFWHGANWTFLVWGLLHGLYLIINHAWIRVTSRVQQEAATRSSILGSIFGFALTFLAVVVAWVFFRSANVSVAFTVLSAMMGRHGAELPEGVTWHLQMIAPALNLLGVRSGGSGTVFLGTWAWISVLLTIAFLAPNARQIVTRASTALERPCPKLGNVILAMAAGFVAFVGFMSITRASAFLYWQF